MTRAYRMVRTIARACILRWIRIEVEGESHLPEAGPCLLLPNHQSVLDPILVQGVCRRQVATMTKSTQFATAPFRWILRNCAAFPVRRYRVDPQAVRVVLRKLAAGEVVCIYPEGERSWDGTLQPFRAGTLRLMLRAGVPVIPVGIEGMYGVWPRWRSYPRLGRTISLRFGRPIHFGAHPTRALREEAMPAAEARLRHALLELSGEAARESNPGWDEAVESSLGTSGEDGHSEVFGGERGASL